MTDRESREADDGATHSPDGVDLTLIRWMLSLTPEQRLAVLQGHLDGLRRLKGEDAADAD